MQACRFFLVGVILQRSCVYACMQQAHLYILFYEYEYILRSIILVLVVRTGEKSTHYPVDETTYRCTRVTCVRVLLLLVDIMKYGNNRSLFVLV